MFMKISSAQGRDNILMLRKAHRRFTSVSEMSPNITIKTVMNVCLIRIAVWRDDELMLNVLRCHETY